MSRVRIIKDEWAFWCLACSCIHRAPVSAQFDQNFDCPTFNREIRIKVGPFPAAHPMAGQVVECHSRIKNGRQTYLPQSTHVHKGETVMVPKLAEMVRLNFPPGVIK